MVSGYWSLNYYLSCYIFKTWLLAKAGFDSSFAFVMWDHYVGSPGPMSGLLKLPQP